MYILLKLSIGFMYILLKLSIGFMYILLTLSIGFNIYFILATIQQPHEHSSTTVVAWKI